MIYFIAEIVQWASSLLGFITIASLVYMKFVQQKTLFSKRIRLPFFDITIESQRGQELVIKIKN